MSKKDISIGKKIIGNEHSVYIIAEAGVNHGGDMALAFQLIDIASNAGADAVKFQAFRTEHLIIDNVEKAPYQIENTGKTQNQAQMLRKLELQRENYIQLRDYCNKKNIQFLITPFDEFSLTELEEIGVDAYKIASTDTTNLPFLIKVAKTGKPIILSTGMCYLNEVEKAVETILKYNQQLILLQCTANYPIKNNEANLNVLHTFRQKFDCVLGYSDHTVGLGAALYAIPMGAKVVEKHFTINKTWDGPDHRASLSPEELNAFVQEVRKVEEFLGTFEKTPTASEMGTRQSLQKCMVAAQPISAGETITADMIVAKRTGGKGISPLAYESIVGSKAIRTFNTNDIIEL